MRCRNCGTELREDESVCPNCGSPIDSSDNDEILLSFDETFITLDGHDVSSTGRNEDFRGGVELNLADTNDLAIDFLGSDNVTIGIEAEEDILLDVEASKSQEPEQIDTFVGETDSDDGGMLDESADFHGFTPMDNGLLANEDGDSEDAVDYEAVAFKEEASVDEEDAEWQSTDYEETFAEQSGNHENTSEEQPLNHEEVIEEQSADNEEPVEAEKSYRTDGIVEQEPYTEESDAEQDSFDEYGVIDQKPVQDASYSDKASVPEPELGYAQRSEFEVIAKSESAYAPMPAALKEGGVIEKPHWDRNELSDYESEPYSETSQQQEVESDIESGIESNQEFESEPDSVLEPGLAPEPESEPMTEPEIEAESEFETEHAPGSTFESISESVSEQELATGTESEPEPAEKQEDLSVVMEESEDAPSTFIPGASAPRHGSPSSKRSTKEPDTKEGRGKSGKKTLVGIIIAVIVIAALAIALGVYWSGLHNETPIAINASFPDDTIGDTSGVPIKIQGKDVDGNTVDEDVLVIQEGQSIELTRGSYVATVMGNPVGRNGRVFTRPLVEYPISVEEGGAEINGGFYQDGYKAALNIDFQTISPESVNDTQLADIRAWMEEYGFSDQEIDEYINAIKDLRNQAIAAAAEAEKKKQEDEARSKAEEAQKAAFKSFPASFSFSSKTGGTTTMTIKRDGSFSGQWRQTKAKEKGSKYPKGTIRICNFTGSFSVLSQSGKTSFRLQLDNVQPKGKASTKIANDRRYIYVTNKPFGLGKMTETAQKGWSLYLRGTKSSVLSSREKRQANVTGSTLKSMVLANDKYVWTGKAAR